MFFFGPPFERKRSARQAFVTYSWIIRGAQRDPLGGCCYVHWKIGDSNSVNLTKKIHITFWPFFGLFFGPFLGPLFGHLVTRGWFGGTVTYVQSDPKWSMTGPKGGPKKRSKKGSKKRRKVDPFWDTLFHVFSTIFHSTRSFDGRRVGVGKFTLNTLFWTLFWEAFLEPDRQTD